MMLAGSAEVLGRAIIVLVHGAKGWSARFPVLPLSEAQVRVASQHVPLVIGLKAGHYTALELASGRYPQEWLRPSEFADLSDVVRLPRGGGGSSAQRKAACRLCGVSTSSSSATGKADTGATERQRTRDALRL
eukprot:9711542-Alexandrium_andersonii.AAC.1